MQIRFLHIFIVSLFVKFVLSYFIPLASDEAYYWVWSKHLQLSYFDHPGMISWLFKLGEPLELIGHAVRWPAVFFAHCSLIAWFYIFKMNQFDDSRFKIFLLLVLSSPLLGFGSLIMTPDLPLLFFWSFTFLFYSLWLRNPNLKWASLMGLSLGLGFCAKYHIALFVPFAIIHLLISKEYRKLKFSHLVISILCGIIGALPVFIWNYQHDFVSFKFQLAHGFTTHQWSWTYVIEYLFGQILILFPSVVWISIGLLRDRKYLLFSVFGWGPILFFLYSSFKSSVEMNWPVIGHWSLFLLFAIGYQRLRSAWVPISFFLTLGLTLFALSLYPNVKIEKLNEFYVAKDLYEGAKEFRPLYADSYQMASLLWYIGKEPIYKLRSSSRHDFYDSLEKSIPTESTFYLLKRKDNYLSPWLPASAKITSLKTFDSDFEIVQVKL